MNLTVVEQAPADAVLARLVTKGQAATATGVTEEEFSGNLCSIHVGRANGTRIIFAGLGPGEEIRENTIRRASGAAARRAQKLKEERLVLDLRGFEEHACAAVEGAILGAFGDDRFKSSGRRETELSDLAILVGDDAPEGLREACERGLQIALAANSVRRIGNTPPNMLNPAALADEAVKLAESHGLKVRVWDEDALRRDGFGGLLAVGGGSSNTPRFILIERHINDSAPTVGLVGKAITFDSGGLSIKPRQAMDEMKYDKMGGVAVLGIVDALCRLNASVNVVAAICSAENLPGQGAYRPSDIVTVYGGSTVEVLDTDAEGRIVLADGLSYVRKNFETDVLFDLATLTGACCIALGLSRSGVFSTDQELARLIVEAGEATGDRCWHLPMGEDYREKLKGRIADVRNIAGSRWGGASYAAEFLRYFVGDARWAHLDIAGPALLLDDRPDMEPGATAAGLRVVVETILRLFPS